MSVVVVVGENFLAVSETISDLAMDPNRCDKALAIKDSQEVPDMMMYSTMEKYEESLPPAHLPLNLNPPK